MKNKEGAILSEVELLRTVRELRACDALDAPLRAALEKAKEEFDQLQSTIESYRTRLGAHTRAVEHAELVVLEDVTAYIPVPNSAYSINCDLVNVEFLQPKGVTRPAKKRTPPPPL